MYYNIILVFCLSISWIHDTNGFITLTWCYRNYADVIKYKYNKLLVNTENRKALGISDDFVLMNIYKIFPRRTRLRRVWRPSIIETTLYDIFLRAISYVETVMFTKINLMDSIITFHKMFATKLTTLITIYSTFRFKLITIAKKMISSIHI